MYDELTEVDIKKMQEEINYRTRVLRPQLIEEVQTSAPSRPRTATTAASATWSG